MFDSVDHLALWCIFKNIGVPHQLVNPLSRPYDGAACCVRVNGKDSAIIPISLNIYSILEDNRNLDICKNNDEDEKYLIQTHSQAKTNGTKLLEVHGIKKELDPNLRPEKQHAMPKQGILEKLQVGQGRPGLRRRRPDHNNQPSDVTQGIPGRSKIETGKINSSQGTNSMHDRAINNNNPFPPDVPLHMDLLHNPSSLQ